LNDMTASIVIPAHDEEHALPRCLDALLADAAPGEFDVVVVCNGCTDRTADVARARGVRVIETPVAGKTHALDLGDDAARSFPRLYVDADVELSTDAARRLVAQLVDPRTPAASPTMDNDLSRCSWPVRAFYAVWTRLPYVREGMIGVGVYALSATGRARFGRFPKVVADDGYVRLLFARQERPRVPEAKVRVRPPRTLADLVRVKTRSRLGGYELAREFPALMLRERGAKSYGGAARAVALRPWLWPAAVVYAWVVARSRVAAKRRLAAGAFHWDRDASSRGPALA
jgi:glycosyltransferase involved in cell wall biosynthesis